MSPVKGVVTASGGTFIPFRTGEHQTHVCSVVLHGEFALEEDAAHPSVGDRAGLGGLVAIKVVYLVPCEIGVALERQHALRGAMRSIMGEEKTADQNVVETIVGTACCITVEYVSTASPWEPNAYCSPEALQGAKASARTASPRMHNERPIARSSDNF